MYKQSFSVSQSPASSLTTTSSSSPPSNEDGGGSAGFLLSTTTSETVARVANRVNMVIRDFLQLNHTQYN